MQNKKAFNLINMKILDNHMISWDGRILNDIKLNDQLYVIYKNQMYTYVVNEIIAYGTKLENISRGMSARLIVKGPEINFIHYTIFFFI